MDWISNSTRSRRTWTIGLSLVLFCASLGVALRNGVRPPSLSFAPNWEEPEIFFSYCFWVIPFIAIACSLGALIQAIRHSDSKAKDKCCWAACFMLLGILTHGLNGADVTARLVE
jgi:hypothetical protein